MYDKKNMSYAYNLKPHVDHKTMSTTCRSQGHKSPKFENILNHISKKLKFGSIKIYLTLQELKFEN